MNVDHQRARSILCSAWKVVEEGAPIEVDEIWRQIWSGTTKTYRYIAMDACLAKAENKLIDAMALQKKDSTRAFDARSLCHNVIVPFEQKYLKGAIGNSMEPFCNKPARAKNIRCVVARNKKHHQALLNGMELLEKGGDAESCLRQLLTLARKQMISNRNREMKTVVGGGHVDPVQFLEHYMINSSGGETAVSVVGALETIAGRNMKLSHTVRVHHVNQSGNSSHQNADIDVYTKGAYLYGIEVKDRNFTQNDVDHFARRLSENCSKGGTAWGMFIVGVHANIPSGVTGACVNDTRVRVVPLRDYINVKVGGIEYNVLRNTLVDMLKMMNASDKCWERLQNATTAMEKADAASEISAGDAVGVGGGDEEAAKIPDSEVCGVEKGGVVTKPDSITIVDAVTTIPTESAVTEDTEDTEAVKTITTTETKTGDTIKDGAKQR